MNKIILIIFIGLCFAGKRDFWDPQDAATPSILKFIDNYDLDNDQLFEKEEYKKFFFSVMENELKDIGLSVSQEQSDDLNICIQDFVDFTDKDLTSYEEFIQDFQQNFLKFLDDDVNRCPIARAFWERFLTNKSQQNKRRKRKRQGDL